MMLTKLLAAGLGAGMVWAMNQTPESPRQRQMILLVGAPVVALLVSI